MNLEGNTEKSCSVYAWRLAKLVQYTNTHSYGHTVVPIRSISGNLQEAVNGLAVGSSFSELLGGASSLFQNRPALIETLIEKSVGASSFSCKY